MFLPTSIKEVRERGWEQLDVILSSRATLISTILRLAPLSSGAYSSRGYRVAIVPQPNWRDDLRDFTKLGGAASVFRRHGRCDGSSMVNH